MALPPPNASARQVVRAYLRALDAHDSATADALSAPSERGATGQWLSSTASITRIQIGSLQHVTSGPAGPQYMIFATFWYASHWWAQDPSFLDGRHTWGYALIRDHGRWQISADGDSVG